MKWILLLAVFIWFILFIRKKRSFKFGLAPNTVEIKPIKGLKKLCDNLEQSLSNIYLANVEKRIWKNNRLKENEYEWRLLDLKRYFIMAYLLKTSPMFSEKVDDLWHEMIMFTREYGDFSKRYLGTTLHHTPNINEEPDSDLRGFFDWVYTELFVLRKENIHLYKGFFRYPVHPDIIDEFRNLPESELIDLYFKSDIKYMTTVRVLISSMKKSANGIKDYDKNIISEMVKKKKYQESYNSMLVPFLSVSYFHYNEFKSYMKVSSNSSSSCNSCSTASFCSSCSSDSSCSSCGGGGD